MYMHTQEKKIATHVKHRQTLDICLFARKLSHSNKTAKKDDVVGRLPSHSSSVMQQQQQQLVPSLEQQQENKRTPSRMSCSSSTPAAAMAADRR